MKDKSENKMEKIGFLFEANYDIGGGHFWRCFNLAKILKKKGRIFYFISKNLNNSLINFLKKENFNYLNIQNLKKISYIRNSIKKKKIDVLISDYYLFDEKKKKKIKELVKTFVVIDDFTHKKHHCDVYINNNFMGKKAKVKIKKLNPNTKLLLGINYFIQPKKILISKNRLLNKKIKKIFVFFGSSDSSHETIKFIKAVEKFIKIKFYILIGRINRDYKEIKKISKNKKNIKIFYNLTNLETLRLMKNKDLSFGAGGINLLERLFQSLPSVVICSANNQKEGLKELKDRKIIYFLGYKNKTSKSTIINCLESFLNKPRIINKLRKNTNKYFNIKSNSNLLRNELNKIIDKNARQI